MRESFLSRNPSESPMVKVSSEVCMDCVLTNVCCMLVCTHTPSFSSHSRFAVSAANTSTSAAAAEKLLNEKKWRFGYPRHIMAIVNEMANRDPAVALRVSKAGLAAATELMEFHGADGTSE